MRHNKKCNWLALTATEQFLRIQRELETHAGASVQSFSVTQAACAFVSYTFVGWAALLCQRFDKRDWRDWCQASALFIIRDVLNINIGTIITTKRFRELWEPLMDAMADIVISYNPHFYKWEFGELNYELSHLNKLMEKNVAALEELVETSGGRLRGEALTALLGKQMILRFESVVGGSVDVVAYPVLAKGAPNAFFAAATWMLPDEE